MARKLTEGCIAVSLARVTLLKFNIMHYSISIFPFQAITKGEMIEKPVVQLLVMIFSDFTDLPISTSCDHARCFFLLESQENKF